MQCYEGLGLLAGLGCIEFLSVVVMDSKEYSDHIVEFQSIRGIVAIGVMGTDCRIYWQARSDLRLSWAY